MLYIIRNELILSSQPASYSIWENIQTWFDKRIEDIGVRNICLSLFPFRDTGHQGDRIEGRVLGQPTPEPVFYRYFKTRIKNRHDLPLQYNEWTAGFQWKPNPQPFIRDCSFRSQEGRTAHLTQAGASQEVEQILDIYVSLYQGLLAVPVTKGRRSIKHRQVGGIENTVTMGYIPATGQYIDGAVVRHLGQTVSKLYDITIEEPLTGNGPKSNLHVWQNSWSLSVRALGLLIATHGDNRGLVLPPRVASVHMVIVPDRAFTSQDPQNAYDEVNGIVSRLCPLGVHATVDARVSYSSGWKLHEWPLAGIPLLMLIGQAAHASQTVTVYRRDTQCPKDNHEVAISDIPTAIPTMLDRVQESLFQKAQSALESSQKRILDNWDDFVKTLVRSKTVCLAPHCLAENCEEYIEKASTGNAEGPSTPVRCLCIPLDQPDGIEPGVTKCITPSCGNQTEEWAMFGCKDSTEIQCSGLTNAYPIL